MTGAVEFERCGRLRSRHDAKRIGQRAALESVVIVDPDSKKSLAQTSLRFFVATRRFDGLKSVEGSLSAICLLGCGDARLSRADISNLAPLASFSTFRFFSPPSMRIYDVSSAHFGPECH